MFDYRDREESGRASAPGRLDLDVSAAAAELRRSGVRKVMLLGAYAGGALSVVAAARLGGSVLLVAAREDRFVPLKQQEELLRVLGSPDKRLVVLPYSLGGWDILNLSSLADRTIGLILRFVHRVTR